MTALVVRKLLIDLVPPIAARWNGGDAFRSAFFSALSMSFPVGEQYFMDSVRAGLKQLPPEVQDRFATEVQGFVGQEATHRRLHGLFNDHLGTLGFDNAMERRAKRRLQANAHRDVRIHVAATAAGDDDGAALDRALTPLLRALPVSQAADLAAEITGTKRNRAYARALELKRDSGAEQA